MLVTQSKIPLSVSLHVSDPQSLTPETICDSLYLEELGKKFLKFVLGLGVRQPQSEIA